jgi:hypothetical protein
MPAEAIQWRKDSEKKSLLAGPNLARPRFLSFLPLVLSVVMLVYEVMRWLWCGDARTLRRTLSHVCWPCRAQSLLLRLKRTHFSSSFTHLFSQLYERTSARIRARTHMHARGHKRLGRSCFLAREKDGKGPGPVVDASAWNATSVLIPVLGLGGELTPQSPTPSPVRCTRQTPI